METGLQRIGFSLPLGHIFSRDRVTESSLFQSGRRKHVLLFIPGHNLQGKTRSKNKACAHATQLAFWAGEELGSLLCSSLSQVSLLVTLRNLLYV